MVKIYINNEELQFTLENETYLGQVVRSVKLWLAKQGQTVIALKVNGNYVDMHDDDNHLMDLERIETIDMSVEASASREIESLQVLFQFFLIMQKCIEEGNVDLLKDLMKEYDYIHRGIEEMDITRKNAIPVSLLRHVDTFLEESGISGEFKIPENTKQIIEVLRMLTGVIEELMREILSPVQELWVCNTVLKKVRVQLEEVAVLLQTGKDKQAMESVVQFAELTQKLIRLFTYAQTQGILDLDHEKIGDESFEEFHKGLNSILSELTDAFTVGDSVLIGDLLEYEVAPRIKNLSEFLDELKEEEP